jgi:hypothetical protein
MLLLAKVPVGFLEQQQVPGMCCWWQWHGMANFQAL